MKLTQLQKALFAGAFTPGAVEPVTGEPLMHTAGINIRTEPGVLSSSGTWWSQIEVHGGDQSDAETLRDFVLQAIDEKIARMTMQEFKDLM